MVYYFVEIIHAKSICMEIPLWGGNIQITANYQRIKYKYIIIVVAIIIVINVNINIDMLIFVDCLF